MRFIRMFIASIFMLLLLPLGGCSALKSNVLAEQLIVQVATGKFIERESNESKRQNRAQRILDICAEARKWVDFEGVNLGQLRLKLSERILAANLDPSERILAEALVSQLLVALNERQGPDDAPIPVADPDFKYRVNTILAWVEGVAKVYVPL
jgi:hypothetical protein